MMMNQENYAEMATVLYALKDWNEVAYLSEKLWS